MVGQTQQGRLTKEIVEQFRLIVGDANLLMDETSLTDYGHDETERLVFLPEIVLKPSNTAQVAAIMKICNQRLRPRRR